MTMTKVWEYISRHLRDGKRDYTALFAETMAGDTNMNISRNLLPITSGEFYLRRLTAIMWSATTPPPFTPMLSVTCMDPINPIMFARQLIVGIRDSAEWEMKLPLLIGAYATSIYIGVEANSNAWQVLVEGEISP